MKMGVVGLGLMGGSWALAARQHSLCTEVIGYDANANHMNKAQNLHITDRVVNSLEGLVEGSDMIVLAVPVDVIEEILPVVLDLIDDKKFVVDFGSTKLSIVKGVGSHPKRSRYLAAHPIAGTEYNGPGAAFSELYKEKVIILCDTVMTDDDVTEEFSRWCTMLNLTMSELTAEEHDLHLAYVSHLSHVTSFSLSNAVLKKEKENQRILELAGSGFASTVRLAKSSPEMWTPIFMQNKEAILASVDAYMEEISTFKNALEAGDRERIYRFLQEGNEIKKILK
ncbi:MAG: prephenate dehydrogenase [Cyclobacteriaceae bacterium]|jgi:prephenate dehydrogenase